MERCQNRIEYYPEVSDVLTDMGKRYTLSIASGSPREFLVHLLKDIEPYFARVFSSVSDYKMLKTPEFYKKMCLALEVQPDQLVHVGDNWQFDVLAPREVGIRAFYLDRSGQSDNQDSLTDLAQLGFLLDA